MILIYIAAAIAFVVIMASIPETMMVYPTWLHRTLNWLAVGAWATMFCALVTIAERSL